MDEKAFPANKYEALAMLYVSSRDISGSTPEELADLYADACQRIRAQFIQSEKDAKALKRSQRM